jgi:DNA/RNA-binding domain of Phe-tRNA-synthetase-like protein
MPESCVFACRSPTLARSSVTSTDEPLAPSAGWVADEVRDEFPELRLLYVVLEARPGRSSEGVKQRLNGLSDRFRGANAVTMRQDPIPWAYRVFYRHVGLDPDAERTPIEAAAVERLVRGRFKADNLLDDALMLALVETGVPVWALDAEHVSGTPGVRVAQEGERLGRDPSALPVYGGRLVVADEAGPLSTLFEAPAPGHGVTKRTTRMLLYSLQVAGVPSIHVEEALHTCVDALRSG